MEYLIIYLISAFLAVIVTPITIYAARRLNVMDMPDLRRVHNRPVPRIGGFALFVPLMLVNLYVIISQGSGRLGNIEIKKAIVLFAAVTFIFIVGLLDDVKHLKAKTKLICQFLAAVLICIMGYRISKITISENITINFGVLSWPATILWILGITNAVNLIDGLDGLAAGLSAVACGVLAVLSLHFGQYFMTVISISLLGALCGFLVFNFNPAKIFMGDCGSLLVGFTIASASLMCAAKTQAVVSLTLPILALGIPIFDMLFSILRRFLARRSLFSPDSEHFHHKLLALGLKQRHIVLCAYSITLAAAGFGMFMIVSRSWQTILIFIGILTLLCLVFRIIGIVKLRQTLSTLRQKYIDSNAVSREKDGFEKARLYFIKVQTFEHWWQSLCFAADKMDFNDISLPVTRRNGCRQILSWSKETNTDSANTMQMTIPIQDRRCDSMLKLNAAIKTNGSLESAARRVRLFNRLLDEYGIRTIRQIPQEPLEKNLASN